ncbi:hypothetical protein [Aeromonas sp. MdU4]|uniref:hypothetical protein n=1 Tax=Aeromonas sp. MdU4 TaxID=3342819 RepID=UPI0035B76C95
MKQEEVLCALAAHHLIANNIGQIGHGISRHGGRRRLASCSRTPSYFFTSATMFLLGVSLA